MHILLLILTLTLLFSFFLDQKKRLETHKGQSHTPDDKAGNGCLGRLTPVKIHEVKICPLVSPSVRRGIRLPRRSRDRKGKTLTNMTYNVSLTVHGAFSRPTPLPFGNSPYNPYEVL